MFVINMLVNLFVATIPIPPEMKFPKIPEAPNSIRKGIPLKTLLDKKAISYLANNIAMHCESFDSPGFIKEALKELEPLPLLERAQKIAAALKAYLPENYANAIGVILKSLTPPLKTTENNGLAVLFYLPHVCFIAEYGLDWDYNGNRDPFDISMKAQYELTKRFSSEFSIRPFLIQEQDRTLKQVSRWMLDPDPHVRRLCSEGTRPRLPWAKQIPSFIRDPGPILPILEFLKDDESLYVRRSVANHLGDIAKDHLETVFQICDSWLYHPTKEIKWIIRHALRHPAKKGNRTAVELRKSAR